MVQILDATAELDVHIKILTNEAKEKTETHPMLAQTKISNCSI